MTGSSGTNTFGLLSLVPRGMMRQQPRAAHQGGQGGSGAVSPRVVFLVVIGCLLGVTVSSVRYLAAAIASTHHAAVHDSSISFEADKSTWHDSWHRTVSHIDQVRPLDCSP
eukprot:scaffold325483_cov34-Prasinocladus_malaysianus.AAC.1